MKDQGVRDGEALWMVPADASWPDPEYDDIAEAVADLSRRGAVWDDRSTRIASITSAGVVLAGGVVAVLRSGPSWTAGSLAALGIALVLLTGGIAGSRIGDPIIGTALGTLGVPYAIVGGLLLFRSGPIGPVDVVTASLVTIGYAIAGLIGTGRPLAPMVATVVVGCTGLLGSAVLTAASPAGTSAVILGAVVLGVGLAPGLAVRVGGLLVQESAGGWEPLPVAIGSGPVDIDRLAVAVTRTDDLLVGLLSGVGVAATGASVALAFTGGLPGRVLLVVCAIVLALRARTHQAVKHRTALLAAAVGVALPMLILTLARTTQSLPPAGVCVAVALVIVSGGIVPRRSSAAARCGDVIEVVATMAVLPLVCVVAGLLSRVPGLGP